MTMLMSCMKRLFVIFFFFSLLLCSSFFFPSFYLSSCFPFFFIFSCFFFVSFCFLFFSDSTTTREIWPSSQCFPRCWENNYHRLLMPNSSRSSDTASSYCLRPPNDFLPSGISQNTVWMNRLYSLYNMVCPSFAIWWDWNFQLCMVVILSQPRFI